MGLGLLLLGCFGEIRATDVADCAPDCGDAPAAPLPSAASLVAALHSEGEAAFLRIAADSGWPAPTTDGLLFAYAADGAWSLAGDFNSWQGEPMTCGDGLCWALLRPTPTSAGYKFTDGSAWVADPWARRFLYDENGELSLVATEDAHLERWFAVGDDTMAPRTVRVLVPAGPVTHVLYAEDGQNLFDPAAIWGGWHLQDAAPAGMLVVGIDNTAARFDEYTPVPDVIDDSGVPVGGQGDAYAAFVQDTVRPLVRAQYGEPGPVGLLGSSLGGLISLHIADRYPGEFAFAASMSGTLGWGSIGADHETEIARYAAAGHRDTAIYLDSGGYGTTCADTDGDGTNDDDADSADNYCETIQLRDTLAAEGYAFDVDLWHWWEPNAAHDEVAWAARVARPLAHFAEL